MCSKNSKAQDKYVTITRFYASLLSRVFIKNMLICKFFIEQQIFFCSFEERYFSYENRFCLSVFKAGAYLLLTLVTVRSAHIPVYCNQCDFQKASKSMPRNFLSVYFQVRTQKEDGYARLACSKHHYTLVNYG